MSVTLGALHKAHELRRGGDIDAARAAYQKVIDAGQPNWAAEARYLLGEMLEEHGDTAGAREQYRLLVEMGHKRRSEDALWNLVIALADEGDLDGLRALHSAAAEKGNTEAPEALVAIGRLLEDRGDSDAARAAYQQAIDTGYVWADDLIEKLNPSPPPTDTELDELPPAFDPRNVLDTGIEVLGNGLPRLPRQLSYLMTIPVSYWTAQTTAVVLFLKFRRRGRRHDPTALHISYSRADSGWTPHHHAHGFGFGFDPVAEPRSRRDLGGRLMVVGGGSEGRRVAPGHAAVIRHGRAAPSVKHIAVVQGGREERRPLDSHFGTWVICSEQPLPLQIQALDADGNVLARIDDTLREWD
jgi:hypothetical protein